MVQLVATNTQADIGKAKVSANNILGIRSGIATSGTQDQLSDGEDEKPSGAVIDFQNVSFSYPTRRDVQVLNNISLRIHSGQTVGIVGESGSGKSTLLALLERFYDVQSGRLQVFGKSISSYDVDQYRSRLAIVPQEPILYKGKPLLLAISIGTNTAFNRLGAGKCCSRCG